MDSVDVRRIYNVLGKFVEYPIAGLHNKALGQGLYVLLLKFHGIANE